MRGDGDGSVLFVTDGTSGAVPSEHLSDRSLSLLPDLPRLFDELTRNRVDCLVLPATVGDQRGVDIARGVTALFPALPIVVVGRADPPADLDVVVVDATALDDPAVADAVRDCLDGAAPAVAGRDPSPMETLLLSLFDEMPHHLYAKDEAARHVMLGRGFNEPTDRLGLTDPEVDDLADEHGTAAYRDELSLVEGERDVIDVVEFLDLDAEYVRTCKVPWTGADGEIRGLIGLTQDITARKQSEHALRRQHERLVKVALVAAHELRNELQATYGHLDRAAEAGADLSALADSLSRIESLVDTVVQLSEREPVASDPEPVWLSRLSREVWDTLAGDDATLEVAADARVVADPESASLLLQILFRNALEHAGPAVTVTVGTTDDGFFVADDGPGLSAGSPERVFDAGYTTVEGNTGLGLYVAGKVAGDQGWTLSASSRAGGARFDVTNVDLAE
ncbi:sensor histidine kinase [Haloarcula litorea]|uniref:sensor histidine kinase n=1 Tax=Haloarcula litorea TaxID=3032579 RepID=UPI0023E7DE07|nr:PAS domain-containing sensor histidine kinase [Halomicroarcula sp. GDY20]